MTTGGIEALDVGCGYHGMPLDRCPCPKGQGAWLDYRALWVAQRRLVDELRATNDLLGREAARHELENRRWRDGEVLLQRATAEAFRGIWEVLEPEYELGSREHMVSFDRLRSAIRTMMGDLRRSRDRMGLLDLIDQGQAHIVVLALAELQLRRPGWNHAIADIVDKLGGPPMQGLLEAFLSSSGDMIKSFLALREELVGWSTGTGLGGPAYPSSTEAGTLLREIIGRLDEAIHPMEARIHDIKG